jgi:hypothetical protein
LCCCVLLQYVVETKFVGEQEMGVAGADIVDIKTRVVDVAQPGPACPVNTGNRREPWKGCTERQTDKPFTLTCMSRAVCFVCT